jgi:hypothetical protein
MYSGDQVFYAVAVSLQQAYDILLAYAEKHNITFNNTVKLYGDTYYINEFECYERLYDQYFVIKGMISQLQFKYIDVMCPSCCNFKYYEYYQENSNIYIGADLGRNDIVYRDNIRMYDDFEQYYESYTKEVVVMKEKIEREKLLIEEEIRQLGVDDCTPKIYSMANDCQRCT